MHTVHSQKLSLSIKIAHLAFSHEIYVGCHIGKTLFKVPRMLCMPCVAKNSHLVAKINSL